MCIPSAEYSLVKFTVARAFFSLTTKSVWCSDSRIPSKNITSKSSLTSASGISLMSSLLHSYSSLSGESGLSRETLQLPILHLSVERICPLHFLLEIFSMKAFNSKILKNHPQTSVYTCDYVYTFSRILPGEIHCCTCILQFNNKVSLVFEF